MPPAVHVDQAVHERRVPIVGEHQRRLLLACKPSVLNVFKGVHTGRAGLDGVPPAPCPTLPPGPPDIHTTLMRGPIPYAVMHLRAL